MLHVTTSPKEGVGERQGDLFDRIEPISLEKDAVSETPRREGGIEDLDRSAGAQKGR